MPKKRPGPAPTEPKTAHGKLIFKRLQELDQTQRWLAGRLGVKPYALNKYIHDDHGFSYSIKNLTLCQVLGFDRKARERYLALWDTSEEEERRHPPAYIRARRLDIGFATSAIRLGKRALHGERDPQAVLDDMKGISDWLRGLPYKLGDPSIASVRIEGDMFLAALQEAVLPWWGNRSAGAIRTYDALEREVFKQIALEQHGDAYARLLLRRAVLRREGKEGDAAKPCEEELRKLRPAFEHVHDPILRFAFECQYLHTLAVIGDWDRWKSAISRVRLERANLPLESDSVASRLNGIYTYAEGVGLKRFMWALRHKDQAVMSAFAERSAESLNRLLEAENGAQAVHDINLYHDDLPANHVKAELESSAIDALVWCKPEEARARAFTLQQQASVIYPAMLGKVTAQIQLINRVMGRAD